jgi:hypothetical protein
MKAPPPRPLEAELTTPRQRATVTAASTAEPPSRNASRPVAEQRASSAATAPWREVSTSRRCERGRGRGEAKKESGRMKRREINVRI